MNQSSLTTRLGEYISLILPDAHGHQRKAITDFVLALLSVQTCCQARLARFFDNFESASKRLSRLIHNARLETEALTRAHAQAMVARLPPEGGVRLALDWTTEDSQHLLVASLRVGARAVPLYWRAYRDADLKERMSFYEREFVRALCAEILRGVARRRFILTADRWFADVDFFDLLSELGISYVIRTKSSYKVRIEGRWRRLDSVRWRGNQRRRRWGRVWYCEGDPRHLYLVQARARDRHGRWGLWHLLSNRNLSAYGMAHEYACRFTGEMVFTQMTKAVVRAVRRGRHHVADLHLAVRDDHAVDQQLDQRAALPEGGMQQPCPYPGAELFYRSGDAAQFDALARRRFELPLLREEAIAALVELPPLALELRQLHDPGQVCLQQPLRLSRKLRQRRTP